MCWSVCAISNRVASWSLHNGPGIGCVGPLVSDVLISLGPTFRRALGVLPGSSAIASEYYRHDSLLVPILQSSLLSFHSEVLFQTQLQRCPADLREAAPVAQHEVAPDRPQQLWKCRLLFLPALVWIQLVQKTC